jgi:hypothetical protein
MSDPTVDLQFDRAEFESDGAAGPTSCAGCRRPLVDRYYKIGSVLACETCQQQQQQEWARGTAFDAQLGGFVRAALFGIAAAALGAAIYYGLAATLHSEWSLVAILVGYLVGGAVKKGSREWGGWVYQGLAVFLTYTSIVSSYLLRAFVEGNLTPQMITAGGWRFAAYIVVQTYRTPFNGGVGEKLLGIVIIGIGLYAAWVINKSPQRLVSGPFTLTSRAGAASATEAPAERIQP